MHTEALAGACFGHIICIVLPRIALLLLFGALVRATDLSSEQVDALVDRAMHDLHVPGAAVGILSDGKVVLAKGYGLRRAGTELPVTADTLFATGSITKSFTSLLVSLLADEKKVDLDRPARDYLPSLELYDPVATQLITLRDMLSHRSGLPRYDSMRFFVHLPRAELVKRLRYLPANHSFRDIYQYNNLMYTTAGYIASVVGGATWEQLVSERIFRPLGMTSSTVTVGEMQERPDFASPHSLTLDTAEAVPFYDYQRFGVGPNGAVNSSVNDMLKYLKFYLEGGTVGGKRLVSEEGFRQLWKPVTVVNDRTMYALGWQIGTVGDLKLVTHAGAITGFTGYMALVPEKKLGVVVLNNLGSNLPVLVGDEIVDQMVGHVHQNRLDAYAAQLANRRQGTDVPRPSEPTATADSFDHRISDYAGEFANPAFGTVTIRRDGPDLTLIFPDYQSKLRRATENTFSLESPQIALMGSDQIRFEPDNTGKISTLYVPLEPAAPPFAFRRRHE